MRGVEGAQPPPPPPAGGLLKGGLKRGLRRGLKGGLRRGFKGGLRRGDLEFFKGSPKPLKGASREA